MYLSFEVTAFLLEIGISIHSVIIGVTLGTSTDDFNALLVALCFHQFFEGLGLGQILSEIADVSERKFFLFLSAMFYALTTPIGVAIGIGIFSEESTTRYQIYLFKMNIKNTK